MTDIEPSGFATDGGRRRDGENGGDPGGGQGVGPATDPVELARRTGADPSEDHRTVDEETFELFEGIAGMAAVGATRDDGALLLWEGPRGWTLPFTPVGPGGDWVAAGETVIEELTGVTFDVADVEAIRRIENERETGGAAVTTHEVVFRAATVSGSVAATVADFEADDDHPDVEWFDAVPDRVDAEADVRLFLG